MTKIKIAINGFGRIGRAAFKAALHHPDLQVVAINDLTDTKTLAHLLKYDSCYGQYDQTVDYTSDCLVVDNKKYLVLAQKEPEKLPWKKLGVQIVIESTGRFTDKEQAKLHLFAGAKKVIISAPASAKASAGKPGIDEVKTFVLGVNEQDLKKTDNIISMASCTTNCLAPLTEVIRQKFGIAKAIMSTAHAYTADQNLVDGPHKDLRRARAAALSIVPTTTGAAIAVTETIPELKNKFDGMAMRVPVPVGSLCDVTFVLKKKTTVKAINQALVAAAKTIKLKGILSTTDEELVSADIVGNPSSSIVDLGLTKVVAGDLVKVVSWYDNEWGYANRLADFCVYFGKQKML